MASCEESVREDIGFRDIWRIRMTRCGSIACIVSLMLVACDGPSGPVATVSPARGEELAEYSRSITDRADRRKDASLYEYFCGNVFGGACPPDLETQLEAFAVEGDRSRLGLADTFVRLHAARDRKGETRPLTDEAYLAAAYQVALGRAPDPQGAADNLAFIRKTGERELMLRSLLQSSEFRSRP